MAPNTVDEDSAGLAERLAKEVRATDFDEFRREEYAILADQNITLKMVMESMYGGVIKMYDPGTADQALAGGLYATRLLRLLGVPPLPFAEMQHKLVQNIEAYQTYQSDEDGEARFREAFSDHPEILAAIDNLGNSSSRTAAFVIFDLHRGWIPQSVSVAAEWLDG
jgi:hypothetical protein